MGTPANPATAYSNSQDNLQILKQLYYDDAWVMKDLVFNKNRFLPSSVSAIKKNKKNNKLNLFSSNRMKLIFKNPFKFFLSLKTPYFNNLKILSPLSKFYFKKLYYTNNILSVFKLNKLD